MPDIVVLGDLNLDMVVEAHTLLDRGVTPSCIWIEAGGSAGNFARSAARLGAHIRSIGCVGADFVGDALIRSLQDHGIETHIQRVCTATGAITTLIQPEGPPRTFCSPGANAELTPAWVTERLFCDVDHLHLSGYAFLSSTQREAAKKAIACAKEAALTISVDPPPVNQIQTFGATRFLEEIAPVEWLFPNLGEGRTLTGKETPEEIVAALSKTLPIGALTLGEDGALAWAGTSQDRCWTEPLTGVETTGAGDAFAAGFVVRYLETEDLHAANRCGNEVAHELLKARIN